MSSEIGMHLKKIIQAIEEHISESGKLPSTTDIINSVDFSDNTVREDLVNLVKQGQLKVVYESPKNPTIYMPEYMYQAVLREQLVPEWAESYKFQKSKDIKKSISDEREKLTKLVKLESLLYASGRILEEAVEEACRLLEFENLKAPYSDPEMWDISFELDGEIFVSDIKGKSTWADKKDVGQLDLWLQKYLDENQNKDPSKVTGLLIINHFKDLEPNERWPESKEKTPLSAAGARYLKLGRKKFITTVDIYEIVKSIVEESMGAEEGREAIMNTMKDSQ